MISHSTFFFIIFSLIFSSYLFFSITPLISLLSSISLGISVLGVWMNIDSIQRRSILLILVQVLLQGVSQVTMKILHVSYCFCFLLLIKNEMLSDIDKWSVKIACRLVLDWRRFLASILIKNQGDTVILHQKYFGYLRLWLVGANRWVFLSIFQQLKFLAEYIMARIEQTHLLEGFE